MYARLSTPGLVTTTLVLAAVVGSIFFFAGLPFVREVPGWFYAPLGPHHLAPHPLVLVAVLVPLAGSRALGAARAARHVATVGWLVVASLSIQVATTAADEPTLLFRLEHGHGEILRVAHDLSERGEVMATVTDYERACDDGTVGGFLPSKPQGMLLFYVAIEAFGELAPVRALLSPLRSHLATAPSLAGRTAGAAAAVLLFPLLTALVVWPLYFLARALAGSTEAGVGAALVWASVPSVALISYHADGALTPLLAVAVGALAVLSGRAPPGPRAWIFAALAGLFAALSLFTNFSMLAIVGLGAVLPLAARAEQEGFRAALCSGLARGSVVLGTTLAVLGLLVATGLFSHPIDRFHGALAHHFAWKSGAIGGVYGALGALEFWSYAGLPLLVAVLLGLGGAARRWLVLVPRPGDSLALLVFSAHVAMAVTAGCSEDARIWLWLVPLLAAGAIGPLRRLAGPARPEALWQTQVAVQLGLLAVMRATQPW